MKITGYKLREKLKMLELKRESLTAQFDGLLFAFPEEMDKKKRPQVVAEELREVEANIATLQAAQAEYNLKVSVTVAGQSLPLALAVKLVGGAQRTITLWTQAQRQISQGADRVRVRRKDDEVVHAEPRLTVDEILQQLEAHERFAAQLRGAIAHGNSQDVDISMDLPA